MRMGDQSHGWISREDWQFGHARCHGCRRRIDPNVDPQHLNEESATPPIERIVFRCPDCQTTTLFHVEWGA